MTNTTKGAHVGATQNAKSESTDGKLHHVGSSSASSAPAKAKIETKHKAPAKAAAAAAGESTAKVSKDAAKSSAPKSPTFHSNVEPKLILGSTVIVRVPDMTGEIHEMPALVTAAVPDGPPNCMIDAVAMNDGRGKFSGDPAAVRCKSYRRETPNNAFAGGTWRWPATGIVATLEVKKI